MLQITQQLAIPDDEFTYQFSRSGGPGGQNVNKVNTKVQLRWNVAESPSLPVAVKQRFLARFKNRVTQDGELIITSQRYRSQEKNLADCRTKLSDLILSVAEPPKTRRRTRPTQGSKQRRLQAKQAQSEKKQRRGPVRLD